MNRGLIIGGPEDGKILEYSAEVWEYKKNPEPHPGPIDYSDMDATRAAMKATSEVGHYYYTDMTILGHSNGRRIGFWVEHDKTLDDALTAILTRYQEPLQHKSLLKRAGEIVYRLLRSLGSPSETEFREARDVIYEIREITDEG